MRHGHVAALVMAAMLAAPAARADTPRLPLVEAVKRGDRPAVVALLRDRGAVHAAEPDGTTALHWAVRADDEALAQLLLKAGAKVTVANRYGVTPLSLAAVNGSAGMIDLLVRNGADPTSTSGEGEPVVMTAALSGRVPALKALVARGSDVNAREGWLGETALMWAASENHADAVRVLWSWAPTSRPGPRCARGRNWSIRGWVSATGPICPRAAGRR